MKKVFLYSILIALTTVLLSSCGSKNKITKKEYNDLVKTYNELKENLPSAKVELKDDRINVTLGENLLFEVNKHEINQSYHSALLEMSKTLNKFPKTNILISGYTDNSGGTQLNQELSKKRADAAKDFLVKSGLVDQKRIYIWGLADRNPIASNATPEGRSQNRRVEFVIMYNYNA